MKVFKELAHAVATGDMNGDIVKGSIFSSIISFLAALKSPEALHAYVVLFTGIASAAIYPTVSFFVKRWLKKKFPDS